MFQNDTTKKKATKKNKSSELENENLEEENSPEVEQELSQVATNPKQNMLILVIISIAFLYLFFNLFLDDQNSSNKEKETPIPTGVITPISVNNENDIPAIPTLPSAPKLDNPIPPPPPPPEEEVTLPEPEPLKSLKLPQTKIELPDIGGNDSPTLPKLPINKPKSEEERKRIEAKRKSAIILISGVPNKKTKEELQQEADFKYRGDMNLILGRGKIIDAIIETAINSDLGGEIRAIISKDIYSEWGKNILLPKGSRVFGNYVTGIDGAYGRISIEWTRIDLANGYRLNLSGSGIDSLGRKGNQGRVDDKFKERFANTVLRSAFNIALANGLDKITKPVIKSQAAASNNTLANNIRNITNTILAGQLTDAEKITNICAQVQAAITDNTSTAYTQIKTTCDGFASSNLTYDQKLTSLTNATNSAADSLLINTANNVTKSKAQEASEQAFSNISDVVKTLVEEREFKPTITIDQGTIVKIYVNKDYKFPKEAINKSRIIK